MLSDLLGAAFLLFYYLVTCFIIPTLLKGWARVPNEITRKFQHVAYAMSVFILLEMFSSWYIAIAATFLLVLVAFPVLMLLERSAFYKKCLTDRTAQGGELRRSMLYVQLSFALLIFFFWGMHGDKWQYIVAVAVMAWGFGDAAAALVGKAFGRHRIIHYLIEGAKTFEGTAAMLVVASLASFITLLVYTDQPWYVSLLIALIVGPICAVVELFSRRGLDTLTVPLTAAFLTMPLVYLFSQVGW